MKLLLSFRWRNFLPFLSISTLRHTELCNSVISQKCTAKSANTFLTVQMGLFIAKNRGKIRVTLTLYQINFTCWSCFIIYCIMVMVLVPYLVEHPPFKNTTKMCISLHVKNSKTYELKRIWKLLWCSGSDFLFELSWRNFTA